MGIKVRSVCSALLFTVLARTHIRQSISYYQIYIFPRTTTMFDIILLYLENWKNIMASNIFSF